MITFTSEKIDFFFFLHTPRKRSLLSINNSYLSNHGEEDEESKEEIVTFLLALHPHGQLKAYLSQIKNIFVSNLKCICPKLKMYLFEIAKYVFPCIASTQSAESGHLNGRRHVC